jgi:hypothetical protein
LVTTPTIAPSLPHTTTRPMCVLESSFAAPSSGALEPIVTKRERAVASMLATSFEFIRCALGF